MAKNCRFDLNSSLEFVGPGATNPNCVFWKPRRGPTPGTGNAGIRGRAHPRACQDPLQGLHTWRKRAAINTHRTNPLAAQLVFARSGRSVSMPSPGNACNSCRTNPLASESVGEAFERCLRGTWGASLRRLRLVWGAGASETSGELLRGKAFGRLLRATPKAFGRLLRCEASQSHL